MEKGSKTTEKRGWLAELFLKKDAPLYKKAVRTGLLTLLAIPLALPLLTSLAAFLPGRDMSDAEKALLRPIFKNAVQYDRVKVHQSAVADSILQLSGSDALAVGNTVIVKQAPAEDWREPDYEMVHEFSHVWRDQNCGDTLIANLREVFSSVLPGNGAFSRYDYALEDGKKLEDYGVEQQASIIADYYRMKKGSGPYYITNQIARGQDAMPLYKAVLVDFLKDPAYLSQVCHPQTP